MNAKNVFYLLCCLSFSVIIGAAVYEHTVVWPNAFAELPRSLTAFQGNYKMNAAPFWMPVHPVTLVLFIITFIINRKSERKQFILIPLVMYIIVLITTFIYFVPELMTLINTPYSDSVDTSLTSRATIWVNLSIIRMFLLIAGALVLYFGLTKPWNTKDNRVSSR